MDNDDAGPIAKTTRRPAVLDTRPVGMEVASDIFSINDKALGAGEPIRVSAGQRVMFHFLNASAIENPSYLALPGHKFKVIALDGNPVPVPAAVDVLMVGPGNRSSAWVEMGQPGISEFWAAPRIPCAKAAKGSSSNTPINGKAPRVR